MSKKIIKHGKYYIGKINYRCSKCSCEFISEPDYVDPESGLFDGITMYVSKCPECGNKVIACMPENGIDNIRESLKRKGVL